MGSYDYTKPTAAYAITIGTDSLMRYFQGEFSISGLSAESMAELKRRVSFSIPSILSGTNGAAQLAATSILAVSEAYLVPTANFVNTLVLLYYDEVPYVSAITFAISGEGIMNGQAMFIKSTDTMEAFLAGDGLPNLPANGGAVGFITEYNQDEVAAMLAAE